MLACFIGLSLLDIAGISLILPYVTALVDPQKIISSIIYQSLIELGAPKEQKSFILLVSVVLFTIFLVKAIFGVFLNRMILKYCFEQGAVLRSYLMASYLGIPLMQYVQRNSSEYIYNMQHLVNQFSQTVLQSGLRIVSESIVILAVIGFVLLQSPKAVLFIGLMFALALGTYDLVFKKLNFKFGNASNNHSDEIIRLVQEGIDGIREIRVLGITRCQSYDQCSVDFTNA